MLFTSVHHEDVILSVEWNVAERFERKAFVGRNVLLIPSAIVPQNKDDLHFLRKYDLHWLVLPRVKGFHNNDESKVGNINNYSPHIRDKAEQLQPTSPIIAAYIYDALHLVIIIYNKPFLSTIQFISVN
jgi:hypothetical protein